MIAEPGGQLRLCLRKQHDLAATQCQIVGVATKIEGCDGARVNVQPQLLLECVNGAGPVNGRACPDIGAMAEPIQPAGSNVFIGQPVVDVFAIESTLGANDVWRPILEQQVYFRFNITTKR